MYHNGSEQIKREAGQVEEAPFPMEVESNMLSVDCTVRLGRAFKRLEMAVLAEWGP